MVQILSCNGSPTSCTLNFLLRRWRGRVRRMVVDLLAQHRLTDLRLTSVTMLRALIARASYGCRYWSSVPPVTPRITLNCYFQLSENFKNY